MRSRSCAALSAIAYYANSSPQAPALINPEGQTLAYKEMQSQIEALSQRLLEAGIGHGERVAVLLPQGVQQVIAVAGILNSHSGIVLQPRTTPAEVETFLRRHTASALIASPEHEAEAEAAINMGLTVLTARDGQSPRDWHVRNPGSSHSAVTSQSDALLFLITSATTGNSKVVPLTVGNLDAGMALTRDSIQLIASDRLLLMVSLCHRIGIESAFAQFLAGGAVIASGGFEPAAYAGWLNNLRPTWYVCSPTVHQAALEQLKEERPNNPVSLRLVQSSGAPLPIEIRQELEQILAIPVLNAYGATEAHHVAVEALPFRGHIADAAGRPFGIEIAIMDTSGELLHPGAIGEIVVRGPSVFSGYLDDAEATRAAFHDGWFRTGDVGRLDEDGNLYVSGRLKEMINRGGEKVSSSEVDAVMASHPAVLEAATFPVPHPTLGEAVACAVVLDPSREAPPQIGELRLFAGKHLARFKVPSRIFIVDEIPRGELGKPQRWVLAERLGSERSAPPSAGEMTEHASDVVFYRAYEIWSRLLDRDDLGFDENFFDAGGDSLGAITMLAEVDQRFASNTSAMAASFLDEPTLAHLVELVGKAPVPRPGDDAANDLRIFAVREQGSPQRLFCIPGDGDEGLYFRRLATHLSGQVDFFTIRPANTWFSQSLFTFEQAGAATATLIRETQHKGPYLVGGYCSGGIVAIEAARQLIREGEEVRLVLFDVYMPGFPSPMRDWRTWVESARAQWYARGKARNENFALEPGYVMKRLGWSAVTQVRPLLVPMEHVAAVQWFLRKVLNGNLPFYKASPIEAPILHFLCANEANVIDRVSRFGWRAMARKGIEEQVVAFDHMNLFHETNLPGMVETLIEWSKTLRPAREPADSQTTRSEVSA